jgi:drug/metabolite transporter (DMT)-like permease
MTYKRILIYNTIKNFLILVILIIIYNIIKNDFKNIDPDGKYYSPLITSIGLILAGSISGSFTFTYNRNYKNHTELILGHVTTVLFMTGIGLLIIIINILLNIPFQKIDVKIPIRIISLIIYLGLVSYDYWDAYNIIKNGNSANLAIKKKH